MSETDGNMEVVDLSFQRGHLYWMLGLFVKLWTREVTGGEEGSQWTVKNTSSTDWNYKSMVHLIALGNPGSRLTIIIQMAAI